MCTYATQRIEVTGSGKAPGGWVPVTMATVYYDHPVHAQAAHTLNIDFLNPDLGPSARVALELSAQSALALVTSANARALASVPPDLLE